MSNRISLTATTFIDHPNDDKSFGFRMYDDFGQTYNNCCDSLITDDFDLLQYAYNNQDEVSGVMFEWISENGGHGMYINDTWYEWDEIQHIFAEKESNSSLCDNPYDRHDINPLPDTPWDNPARINPTTGKIENYE
jgi:hypothetical protein